MGSGLTCPEFIIGGQASLSSFHSEDNDLGSVL